MQGLTYPRISLDHAAARLGRDTFHRGTDYARNGWVLRCLWSPDAGSLVGSVRGNRGRAYATTVHLVRGPADTWALKGGRCSCPMQVDCKHVAALMVKAAGTDQALTARATWQQSLEALLPETARHARAGGASRVPIPLGVELNLIAGTNLPKLEARVVRPGKRRGKSPQRRRWSRIMAPAKRRSRSIRSPSWRAGPTG